MTSLNWSNVDDVRAVQAFHAPLFKRWKKRHGLTWGLTKDRDFRESLQRLHDYGYSMTDISAMWGVSRERARQWFEEMGLERHDDHASVRVWDDELELFLPVTKEEYEKRAAAARRANRIHAALMADVAMVQEVAAELGRTPILADLAEYMYGDRRYPIAAAHRWGYGSDCNYTEAMDRLYDAAGLEKPSSGEAQRRRDDNNRRLYSRQEVVDTLRQISNGKPAGKMELCRALDRYSGPKVAYNCVAHLFGRREGLTYAEAWDRLYQEAFPYLSSTRTSTRATAPKRRME